MKRVAHVLWRSRGGIRRHVRSIAMRPPRGWTTSTVYGPADLADYFSEVPFVPSSVRGLRRALSDAEVVHAHGVTAGTVAIGSHRTPVVLSLHTILGETGRTASSRLARVAAKVIASRADVVVAVSRDAAAEMRDVRIVPPVFDPLPAPTRSRSEVRAELGASESDVVAVCVARVESNKRLELFVDAVTSAGAVGWIVGDGADLQRVAALASGTSVTLLGYRSDVSDVLHAADLFVLPSVSESYGIAVAEAVGAGLPVVASRSGEIATIVGEAGICVDRDDDRAFVDAVGTLVRDADARRRLASNARASLDDGSALAALGAAYDAALLRRRS